LSLFGHYLSPVSYYILYVEIQSLLIFTSVDIFQSSPHFLTRFSAFMISNINLSKLNLKYVVFDQFIQLFVFIDPNTVN